MERSTLLARGSAAGGLCLSELAAEQMDGFQTWGLTGLSNSV